MTFTLRLPTKTELSNAAKAAKNAAKVTGKAVAPTAGKALDAVATGGGFTAGVIAAITIAL